MIAHGGVYIYKSSEGSIPTRQLSGLSYGPLRKIKLENTVHLPHFSLLDYTKGDSVVSVHGRIEKWY